MNRPALKPPPVDFRNGSRLRTALWMVFAGVAAASAALGAISLAVIAMLAAAFALEAVARYRRRDARRPLRTAVIGSRTAAAALREELALADVKRFVVVGSISPSPPAGDEPDAPGSLGSLAELGNIVEGERIDLLLMANDCSRLLVFEQLMLRCDALPVRLWELSAFYEEIFGHIPVAVINSAWFMYLRHPRFRPTPPRLKRGFDLTVAILVAVATAPLMALAALLVRLDGGPALYRQVRVGEGGRTFTMLKLRTMRWQPEADSPWTTSSRDPRITGIGVWLRRTHMDELPQLLNIIRGEMSIVGPRPEQPHYVAELERKLPFYVRRHEIKPGLTGWAQVHCGYGGSESGSLWKLSHDLYYLKHRSMWLDLKIVLRTTTGLRADQFAEPRSVPFVFQGGLESLPEPAPASVALVGELTPAPAPSSP